MSKPRILFLPLSNVLGHLTRTFSLVEEFLKHDADIHIACDTYYSKLIQALPEGITVHKSIEMPVSSSRSFGAIKSFDIGETHDELNLESANHLSAEDLKMRGHYLKEMVKNDRQLVAHLKPDLIVTDYRYTVTLLSEFPKNRIFHISNMLGFLSFYNRTRNTLFSPLDTGNILVPGIPEIELTDKKIIIENPNINWCGHFSWQGWKRLYKDTTSLEKVDIFLCFGSTGNGDTLVPWLIQNIDKYYKIRMVSDSDYKVKPQENVHHVKFGYLEACLTKSNIVCCHGGHGTVMECIIHKTPMLIFPNNIEQLEIGRQIEKLGLGILMDKPQEMLDAIYLNATIERLLANTDIKKNLTHYSELLKQYDGSSKAASIIMETLIND